MGCGGKGLLYRGWGSVSAGPVALGGVGGVDACPGLHTGAGLHGKRTGAFLVPLHMPVEEDEVLALIMESGFIGIAG